MTQSDSQNTGDNDQDIRPLTQILVDGDLSEVRLQFLISLGHEEERLDYKEHLNLEAQDKAEAKKWKIDLVADICALANTDGGYIIVGVKETDSGQCITLGIDDDAASSLKQEKLQDLVQKYADGPIRLKSRLAGHDATKSCMMIFVSPGTIPVIFKIDGQYLDKTKFRTGDVFVRHGTKTERAGYDDWQRLSERIRNDERRKVFEEHGRHTQILDRLDQIITLLGGAPRLPAVLDLSKTTGEDLEEHVTQILISKNTLLFKRLVRRIFKDLLAFLEGLRSQSDYAALVEDLERTFSTSMSQLLALWVTLLEYESYENAAIFADEIHEFFCACYRLDYRVSGKRVPPIWLQSRVMFAVYGLIAYAIHANKPMYGQLFLYRTVPFYRAGSEKESWFRYVLTELARAELLVNNSLCFMAFQFLVQSTYYGATFRDPNTFRSLIFQADFLQCYECFLVTHKVDESWPSFAALEKGETEPIIEKIIDTHKSGVWVQSHSTPQCVQAIQQLDAFAYKHLGGYGHWWQGDWDSSKVRLFMQDNRSAAH